MGQCYTVTRRGSMELKGEPSAAFLIGAEEKDLACRVVRTCFELHFYMSANEERSTSGTLLTRETLARKAN